MRIIGIFLINIIAVELFNISTCFFMQLNGVHLSAKTDPKAYAKKQ